MRDLNIDFMDLYKSVDRFIKDAYSSSEGVSEYIRQMELNFVQGGQYVSTWSEDYNKLKQLRRIRNQLAHEVGYDSDICEESDYNWLESFNSRLYSASDPLAVMNQAENAERQRRAEEQRRIQAQKRAEEERRRQMQMIQQQQQPSSSYTYMPQPQYQPPKKKSFWQRLKEFFGN